MGVRLQRWLTTLFVAGFCAISGGCGSHSPIPCQSAAGGGTCICACPVFAQPVLFASTTSNQILGFSIAPSGSLTSLAPVSGPANSQSITNTSNTIYFADSTANQVAAESWTISSGTISAVPGSPFSLGTGSSGPTSLLADDYLNLYASEPNGTIVGYSTEGEGALTAPLPNSPYPAGVTPAQMAYTLLATPGSVALYASDPGDSVGGILGFSINSDGSLTALSSSPFATVAGAGPSFLLQVTDASENQFLFASLSNTGQIAAFQIDTSTGALTPAPGSPFTVGNGPGTLASTYLNGSSELFVMNTLDHTVAAFTISSTGSLTALGSPVPVGTASGGMAIYPGGDSLNGTTYGPTLYTADTSASAIDTVNVSYSTGAISAGTVVPTSLPPVQLIEPNPY